MSGQLAPIFGGKRKKWYVMLAVPLLIIITVYEVADWGASNGIMVISGGSMGLYYDQIFSNAGFLVLTILSMSAAGIYVFGMNRIYLEQEKAVGIILRLRFIKCWQSSTGSRISIRNQEQTARTESGQL